MKSKVIFTLIFNSTTTKNDVVKASLQLVSVDPQRDGGQNFLKNVPVPKSFITWSSLVFRLHVAFKAEPALRKGHFGDQISLYCSYLWLVESINPTN